MNRLNPFNGFDPRIPALEQSVKTITSKTNVLSNTVQWMIASANRAGEQLVTSGQQFGNAIHGRLRTYGDTLAKQYENPPSNPADAFILDRHVKWLNKVRKDAPKKFGQLQSIATSIKGKSTDVQKATLGYYFGDPTYRAIGEAHLRYQKQVAIRSLLKEKKPVPDNLTPFYSSELEIQDPVPPKEPNLSLTYLKY